MLWTLEHQPDLAFVFNKKHEFSTLSIEAECRCEKRVGVTLRITVLNSVLQQFWENTSESIAHLFSDIWRCICILMTHRCGIFLPTEDKVWTIVSHDLQMQMTLVGYNPEEYSAHLQRLHVNNMSPISARCWVCWTPQVGCEWSVTFHYYLSWWLVWLKQYSKCGLLS